LLPLAVPSCRGGQGSLRLGEMALAAKVQGAGRGSPEHRDAPASKEMGDVQRLIVACNQDGMDKMKEGNLKDAFEQFKYAEAILLANQLEGDSTALLATTCNNLGCYYKKVGKFHGALSYLRRALKMEVELSAAEVSLAGTHLNLCAVLSKLEKHDKAVQHALMALEMMNRKIQFSEGAVSVDDYTVLSIAYHNVGLERQLLEQWDQAATSFRTGYEVAKRFLGSDHALTVTLYNNSNAVLHQARQVKERPGISARKKTPSGTDDGSNGAVAGGGGNTLVLPPILQPKKEKTSPRKMNTEASDYLKSEENLWANFALKTLSRDGPAIEEDIAVVASDQEDMVSQNDAMRTVSLSRAALANMQDLGLIMPQAYDMGLFRFQDKTVLKESARNPLEKALDDNPKALMDIIDAAGDGEPSLSTPNDFRPNRVMKRSTRTSRVVRRTGVFNSTTQRDRVLEDFSKSGAGRPAKAASAEKQREAASKIQTVWRMWHKYLRDNSEWMTVTWICATMIQSHWRSYHVRRQKLDKLVTHVQRHVRGILVRRTLKWHNAAVRIQKRMMGILTRMKLKRLHQAATHLQKWVRGHLARRYYGRFFNYKVGIIITMQRYTRLWLAQRKALARRNAKDEERLFNKATTDLQRMFRGWKGRSRAAEKYQAALEAKREYNAATKLQSAWRSKQARRRVDGIREQRLQEMEKAATFLRKVWLGAQTKKQYKQLTADFKLAEGTIIVIQRYMRGCLCRMRLWQKAVKEEENNWAAIEIQRHWRGYQGRVKWENALEQVWRRELAAVLLQRNLRGWVARSKVTRTRRKIAREQFERARRRFFAAQKIQARSRGILARKDIQYRLVRARRAATCIQRIQRGGRVRVAIWRQVREQRSLVMQAAMRGYLVRKRKRSLLQKVITLQLAYRRWLKLPRARRLINYHERQVRKVNATKIQTAMRAFLEFRKVSKTKAAVAAPK